MSPVSSSTSVFGRARSKLWPFVLEMWPIVFVAVAIAGLTYIALNFTLI
jgi:hypothetical protein